MAFTSLLLDTSTGSVTSGMGSYISDLSKTIGVDLFEEDIDNVVFRTNEFLCSADFIGSDGPFWYPSSTNNNGSILDALAFIPNCIGSYTHDLYEAEAVQVSEKYNELMPLIQKRDSMYHKIAPTQKVAKEIILSEIVQDASMQIEDIEQKQEGEQLAQEAADRSIFAGLIIGLDKIVMFLALVIYRIGWWSTIFCQQILLGMLTIFGPIQWAFSVLPKWEGAWAKWITRYLTVHFYGAMLYFVGLENRVTICKSIHIFNRNLVT